MSGNDNQKEHNRQNDQKGNQNKGQQQKGQDKPKAPEDVNRLIKERIRKLGEIREREIEPYPYSFDVDSFAVDLREKYSHLQAGDETQDQVSVAGRVMAIRIMGKASFMQIQDSTGKLQLFLSVDKLGKPDFKFQKKLDIGDFVGAKGIMFKTKTGEPTVNVDEYQILSKSLRPLPEKWHGLQDVEMRYRRRYLDLMTNPDVKEVFKKRSLIVREIRNFLDNQGFLEVETPMLQPIYGGAAAKPFTTHHNALNMPLYMKISPELYLKRLIVGGFDKVYDMSKNFRNEGLDKNHNPEFTMLEWYEAYTDYEHQMHQFEDLVSSVAEKITGSTIVSYQGTDIDLTPPWKRITMVDALKEYADIDVTKYDDEEIKDLVNTYNLEYSGDLVRGNIINVLFEELVEDKLIQPTFITDHPIEVSPLTKVKRGNPTHVERFEPFICGMEVGNAYSELNDPIEQNKRLELQAAARATDEEAHPMDKDFVMALEYGMPPCGGVGLGVDRVVMIILDQPSIRDVILFPTMKPEPIPEEKKSNSQLKKEKSAQRKKEREQAQDKDKKRST